MRLYFYLSKKNKKIFNKNKILKLDNFKINSAEKAFQTRSGSQLTKNMSYLILKINQMSKKLLISKVQQKIQFNIILENKLNHRLMLKRKILSIYKKLILLKKSDKYHFKLISK